MPRKISPQELIASIGTERFPVVVDVRRESVFRNSERRIAGSVWRDHLKTAEWLPEMPLAGGSSSTAPTVTMSASWRSPG